jgi:hypothetical protein
LRAMVASRSKVSLWPVSSTRPGNYGWLSVLHDRRHRGRES